MQLWIWRHFRIKLPADWEMLQFTQNPDLGTCMFADRHQFRLEFSWRKVQGPPDFDRMLSDYIAKLKESHNLSQMHQIRIHKWRGIEGKMNSLFTSRFGAFFTQESCVVELVFLWPEGKSKEPEVEKDILNSVSEAFKPDDTSQRWKSFGMDMQVSRELILKTCEVKPAYASLTFTSSKSKRQEEFQRLGMIKQWLNTGVRAWLPYQTPKQMKIQSQNFTEISRHRIETVHGYEYRKLWSRIFRRTRLHRGSAWICPNNGRLYYAACTYPSGQEITDLAGQKLSCCEELKK